MRNRGCEELEPRKLLAATLDANGALSIVATSGDDVVGISLKTTKLRVGIGATTTDFTAASVKSISIDLGDGADTLVIAHGVGPVYCLGGLGDDTISGGDFSDSITAGGGKDLVYGGAGDDRIDGGPTNDVLYGDDGADRIYGSDANDALYGVAGVDRLFGGVGSDTLVGGSSNDKLYGDDGNDSLLGGNQNDLLTGGAGSDQIYGNDGNDTLYGQGDDDELFGQAGDDQAYGDANFDRIDGGAGNDTLDGADGEDTLLGSDGNDLLTGDAGNDNLYGGNGADTEDGGADDDYVAGDAGTDNLSGNDGNDALFGGSDHDALSGNGGADRFLQRQTKTDDSISDRKTEDAVLTFVDGDADWTDNELAQIDVGLYWMVRRTNNTKLLKLSSGGDIAIVRMHNLGTDVLADNVGDGRIEFADLAFTDQDVPATIVHEMGHNWDDADENPTLQTFFDISRWRKKGGVWTYDTNSQFASSYGRTNPVEDFATSLEVYFSQVKSPSLWQAKWNYIDGFLDGLST